MRPARIPLYVILATVVLLTASCGGAPQEDTPADGGEPATTQTTTDSTGSTMMDTTDTDSMMETTTMESTTMGSTTGEQAAEGPPVMVVEMSGLAFDPARVTVSPGTTVRWENEDDAEHNVISEGDDGPLQSDAFRNGGSYEYTFEETGEFAYFCTIHPFMKGAVVVR